MFAPLVLALVCRALAACVSSLCSVPATDCNTCATETFTGTAVWDGNPRAAWYCGYGGACQLNTSMLLQVDYNACAADKNCCIPHAGLPNEAAYANFTATDRGYCGSQSCIGLDELTLFMTSGMAASGITTYFYDQLVAEMSAVVPGFNPNTDWAVTTIGIFNSVVFLHDITTIGTTAKVPDATWIKLEELYQSLIDRGFTPGAGANLGFYFVGLGCQQAGFCERGNTTDFTDCCDRVADCTAAGFSPNVCEDAACINRNCEPVPRPLCCVTPEDCNTYFYNGQDPSRVMDPLQLVCVPDPAHNGSNHCEGVYSNTNFLGTPTMCSSNADCGGLSPCANATCQSNMCVVEARAFPATQLCCAGNSSLQLSVCQPRVCETATSCNASPMTIPGSFVVALPDFTCQYTQMTLGPCCVDDATCTLLSQSSPCIFGGVNGVCPNPGGPCLLSPNNSITNAPCCYSADDCGTLPPTLVQAPGAGACQYYFCSGADASPASDAFQCQLANAAPLCNGVPSPDGYLPSTTFVPVLSSAECRWNCDTNPPSIDANVLQVQYQFTNNGPGPIYAFDVEIDAIAVGYNNQTIHNVLFRLADASGDSPTRPSLHPVPVSQWMAAEITILGGLFLARYNMTQPTLKMMPGETWTLEFDVAFSGVSAVELYVLSPVLLPYDVCTSFYLGTAPNCMTLADVAAGNKLFRSPTIGATPPATSFSVGYRVGDVECDAQCIGYTGNTGFLVSGDNDTSDASDVYSEFFYPTPAPTPSTPYPTPPGQRNEQQIAEQRFHDALYGGGSSSDASDVTPAPTPMINFAGINNALSSDDDSRDRRRHLAKRQTFIATPAVSSGNVGGVVFYDGNGDGENTGPAGNDTNLPNIAVYVIDAASGATLGVTLSAPTTGVFQFNAAAVFGNVTNATLGAFFRILSPPLLSGQPTNVTVLGTQSNSYIDNAFVKETVFYINFPVLASAAPVVSSRFTNTSGYVQLNAGFVLFTSGACAPNTTGFSNATTLVQIASTTCGTCAFGAPTDLDDSCTASRCAGSAVQQSVEVEFTVTNLNLTLVNGTLTKPGSVLFVEFTQPANNTGRSVLACVDAEEADTTVPSPTAVTLLEDRSAIFTGPFKRNARATFEWKTLPFGVDVVRFRVRFNYCANTVLLVYNITATIQSNYCLQQLAAWSRCQLGANGQPVDPRQCYAQEAVSVALSSCGSGTCPPTPAPTSQGGTPAGNASASSSDSSDSDAPTPPAAAAATTSDSAEDQSSSDSSDAGDYASSTDLDSSELSQLVAEANGHGHGDDSSATDRDDSSSTSSGNSNNAAATTLIGVAVQFAREPASCVDARLVRQLHCDDERRALDTCALSSDAGTLKAIVQLATPAAHTESGVVAVTLERDMPARSQRRLCRAFDPALALEVLQDGAPIDGRAKVLATRITPGASQQTVTVTIQFASLSNTSLLSVVLSVLECPDASTALNYTLTARLATSRCFNSAACTSAVALPPTSVRADTFCTSFKHAVFASDAAQAFHGVALEGRADLRHGHGPPAGQVWLVVIMAVVVLCFGAFCLYSLQQYSAYNSAVKRR